MECLRALVDDRWEFRIFNVDAAIQIAVTYRDKLTNHALIKLFTTIGCCNILFYFLEPIVDSSLDPEVIHTYIRVSIQLIRFNYIENDVLECKLYGSRRGGGTHMQNDSMRLRRWARKKLYEASKNGPLYRIRYIMKLLYWNDNMYKVYCSLLMTLLSQISSISRLYEKCLTVRLSPQLLKQWNE